MTEAEEIPTRMQPGQRTILAVVVACTFGGIVYRLLTQQHLSHTAAMFLGLPLVLAIPLALAPPARSVTGSILKGITLFLLVLAPILGEGFLCILIAAPLFYIVGIAVGVAVDWQRRHRAQVLPCMVLLLLPMCLEGVVPQLTFDRTQTVEARRIVAAPAAAVEQALALTPDLGTSLPLPLRIGFPRPLAAWGGGLALGDTRSVRFSGAEGAPPGDLLVRVTERRLGYARLATISDHTKLSQWIRWTNSEVAWSSVDSTHTAVTWTIHFERQLDPAWYFTPFERGAVHEAAAFLIAANATPRGRP